MKNDENGKSLHKARYVAKGFSQTKGINYSETFSPTARLSSVRILASLAVNMDMHVHQLDFKTAYLNAPIDYDIFVEQPVGFEVKNNENFVWKLNKSLYGLKQSGRMWYFLLHDFLTDLGFKNSAAENCIYFKHSEISTIILVWVDDLLMASRSLPEILS